MSHRYTLAYSIQNILSENQMKVFEMVHEHPMTRAEIVAKWNSAKTVPQYSIDSLLKAEVLDEAGGLLAPSCKGLKLYETLKLFRLEKGEENVIKLVSGQEHGKANSA